MDFIRRVLSIMLTNEIADKYNFFGRKEKKPFCNLNICKLLISKYYILEKCQIISKKN